MKFVLKNSANRKKKWHSWYARHPVAVETLPDGSTQYRVFEWIERRGKYIHALSASCWVWKYRSIPTCEPSKPSKQAEDKYT